MDFNTRFLQAVFFLNNPVLGSLWWVSNKIWKLNPDFILKENQNNGRHPGVSILKNSKGYSEVIPMLMGTSRKDGKTIPFKMDDEQDRFSHYGSLRPVYCPLTCFSEASMIMRNQPKSHLSLSDCEKLEKFVQETLK